MTKRIENPRHYIVENTKTGDEWLVRAMHKARAEKAVNEMQYRTRLATQDDIVRLISAGQKVTDTMAAPAGA